MSQVVTLEHFIPVARFDGNPWTQALIEEGDTAAGPWTLIDTITITPVDSNPAHPASRSFTTELASETPALWYRIIFLDATGDDTLPTTPIQNVDETLTRHIYVTADELKRSLTLQNQAFADEDIEVAIGTASRVVDDLTDRRFWADPDAEQVRYYTPNVHSSLEIDDLIELTEVAIDRNGDGSYATIWALGADFCLEPANAPADGRPWERIVMPGRRYGSYGTGYGWGYSWYEQSVRVTGRFGWPALPDEVASVTKLLATRYLNRQRGSAIFGMVTAGQDSAAIARIARTDGDVMNALSRVTRTRAMIS